MFVTKKKYNQQKERIDRLWKIVGVYKGEGLRAMEADVKELKLLKEEIKLLNKYTALLVDSVMLLGIDFKTVEVPDPRQLICGNKDCPHQEYIKKKVAFKA